jgi:nucleoside 2-deoxyribosyltransferase
MQFYIAGPFFNEAQVELMTKVEKAFDDCNVERYCPRAFSPGSPLFPQDAAQVFTSNLQGMDNATHLLAVVDWALPPTQLICRLSRRNVVEPWGKALQKFEPLHLPDSGTVFEMGYFRAQEKPVILFTQHPAGHIRINVMLAQAATGVAYGIAQLRSYLQRAADPGRLSPWRGDQE